MTFYELHVDGEPRFSGICVGGNIDPVVFDREGDASKDVPLGLSMLRSHEVLVPIAGKDLGQLVLKQPESAADAA